MSLLASFMNLAGPDLIVILLIVLVLFGAKKLPELAKGMGQAVREFQKAKDEFSDERRAYQEARLKGTSYQSGSNISFWHFGHGRATWANIGRVICLIWPQLVQRQRSERISTGFHARS